MAILFFRGSERVESYSPNFLTHFPSHLIDLKWAMRSLQNQSPWPEDSYVLINLGPCEAPANYCGKAIKCP